MSLDCDDLIHHGDNPYDGVWHPDEKDHDKEINVSFDTMQYIDSIVLYDSPSPRDNILNAMVILDDGTELSTGKLASSGTAVSVKKEVRSFKVRIDEYEGSCFGFSEIEAFANADNNNQSFYKIVDDKDNFVYDYIIPPDGKQWFGIYRIITNDDRPPLFVHCDNKKCVATINGEAITVICPQGQKCILTLFNKDDIAVDRVLIRNPREMLVGFSKYVMNWKIHQSYVHRIYNNIKSKNPHN